jgi:hypothetical protein
MGTELAITSADASGKPSAAVGSRTPSGGHHAGDFPGELLPDGVDESCRPVSDHELRWPFVGRGDQFQSAAGNPFRYLPGQVFPSQVEQVFPFSRLMLG